MQRRLVIRNEAAGHPFRRMLPPPILDRDLLAVAAPKKQSWWKREDTHLFTLSFFAFFVAISTFIA